MCQHSGFTGFIKRVMETTVVYREDADLLERNPVKSGTENASNSELSWTTTTSSPNPFKHLW